MLWHVGVYAPGKANIIILFPSYKSLVFNLSHLNLLSPSTLLSLILIVNWTFGAGNPIALFKDNLLHFLFDILLFFFGFDLVFLDLVFLDLVFLDLVFLVLFS